MGGHKFDHRADNGPGVIKITKAGWLYIILTIFLGFSAVNTGNNLIYLVVAAFLSFMGISGFFGKRNLSKIDIEIEIPEEVYAKTSFPLKIVLSNKRRFLPAFLIRAHIMNHEILFPFVDSKEKEARHLNFYFHERGRSRIEDIHICSVFPFNFFVRCRKIDRLFETIVFPEAKKSEFPGLFEKQRRARGERSTDKPGYDADIVSVREYIGGDPLKYIHWKASAKTGSLKTKELSSLSQQPVVIDFDALPIKHIEDKISSVTYVILKLFKRNIPVGLKIRGVLYKPFAKNQTARAKTAKLDMLRKLALYEKE